MKHWIVLRICQNQSLWVRIIINREEEEEEEEEKKEI